MPRNEPLGIRLWGRIDQSAGPDGCWPWTGHIDAEGYGRIRVGSKRKRVHRLAFEMSGGEIPEGDVPDHTCHTDACVGGPTCPHRRCCNPAHIEAVDNATNVLRGVGVTARNAVKTHCPKGHPYAGSNLILRSDGARTCRACIAEREAKRPWRAR